MSARFTLGIEEEFQLVKRLTGELSSSANFILEKGTPYFEENLKPEMLQSTVELISDILPDIVTARIELTTQRTLLMRLLEEEGLALISAGTHPSGYWRDQERTVAARYAEIEDEYQDLGRSLLIFGLHVHVGVEDKELAVMLMNQLRTWLPHLLAISANSPFWNGHYTGLKSYRSAVWKRFPRSGLPEIMPSRSDFDRYVQTLVDMGCIDDGKKIWWDMRPHPFFDTVEFRICDMPATLEDTLAIAALCQALVAKLTWLHEHSMQVQALPRDYIEENKWRAMRYGLDAEIVDFVQRRRIRMRDSIHELLDCVEDVVDDLGSRREMNYLRTLLDDPNGTGADRQIAIYQEHTDVDEVSKLLMRQTMQGLGLEVAPPANRFLRFKLYWPAGQAQP